MPYSPAKNTIISSSDGLRSYCDAPWRIKPTHKPFRLLYAWGIINAGICSCDDIDTMPKVVDIRAPDVTRSSEVAAGQFCSAGCGYLPAHMGKMAGCWLCRWRNRGSDNSQNTSITVCSCASCALPLCLREEKDYFRDFHKRETCSCFFWMVLGSGGGDFAGAGCFFSLNANDQDQHHFKNSGKIIEDPAACG